MDNMTIGLIFWISVIVIFIGCTIYRKILKAVCTVPIKADIVSAYIDFTCKQGFLFKHYKVEVCYTYNGEVIRTQVKGLLRVWSWQDIDSKDRGIVYINPNNPTQCIIKPSVFWEDVDNFDIDLS